MTEKNLEMAKYEKHFRERRIVNLAGEEWQDYDRRGFLKTEYLTHLLLTDNHQAMDLLKTQNS